MLSWVTSNEVADPKDFDNYIFAKVEAQILEKEYLPGITVNAQLQSGGGMKRGSPLVK